VLKTLLKLGLSEAQEERFRQANRSADVAQARISIVPIALVLIGFGVNDYGFFGLSWPFWVLTAVRLALLVHTLFLLLALKGFKSYQDYDRAEFVWGLFFALFTVAVAATRPATFIAHTVVAVLAVFITVLAIPNRFANQLILSLIYTVGETVVLALGFRYAAQASLTALLSMLVANSIAVACARVLHSWRRREFLARQEAQAAVNSLRETERRWATTIASIGDGVIATDGEGRIAFMNHVAERVTGWNLAEAAAKPATEVFVTLDEARLQPQENPVARVLRDGATVGLANHTVLRRRDGTVVPVDDSAAPIRDDSATITGVVLVFRDITERRRSEEALRESETTYRMLFDNMTEEVHFWKLVRDERGAIATWRLVDANPPALKTWNKTHAEVKGKTTDEIFGPGSTGHYMPIVQKIMTEGVPYSYEDFFPNLDRHFRFTSVPLAEYFITTGADITPLRKAHDELERRVRERTDELERSTTQLRSLALKLTETEGRERKRLAAVLHDHLQQLLVGAKLGMQVAQKRCKEESLKESFQNVEELLDESMKLSRSLTVELAPPILYESGLVAGLKWLARWMQERHGLAVDVDVAEDAPDVPKSAEVVSTLVFQTVRELLFNVLKHAQVNDARVSIGGVDGLLHVAVIDKGVGLDDARALGRGSELGFGLFSIRERMELLGGRVEIESAPGSGTRVTIVVPLPVRAPETVDAAAAAVGLPARVGSASERGVGRRIRVLVADDHKIVREGFVALIQSEEDIDVVGEASNGKEAIEMARLLRPDVIVMDVSMPGMNGIEATTKIMTEMEGVRVIGLSMFEKADSEEAMRTAGAVAYLTKDGPSKDLITAIRASVAHR
jgi:PAS domain S-box-containing protein